MAAKLARLELRSRFQHVLNFEPQIFLRKQHYYFFSLNIQECYKSHQIINSVQLFERNQTSFTRLRLEIKALFARRPWRSVSPDMPPPP